MKKKLLYLFFTFSLLNLNGFDINISIVGIEDDKGKILIGLFESSTTFPILEEGIAGASTYIYERSAFYTFKNILPGNYAVAVIHDKNENGVLDLGFLGIPKEGYAFSRNKTGLFGPPKFKDVSITLDQNKDLTIILEYK